MDDRQLARALGWFSIGLGLAEIAMPGKLARTLNVEGQESWLRAFGLRELATGIGILASEQPAGWIQARVAGDALDLGFLGTAMANQHDGKGAAATALAAVAGVTLLDVTCALSLADRRSTVSPDRRLGREGGLHVSKSVTIDRPAAELYDFWTHFEQLPRVMNHLTSVENIGAGRSHWIAKGPAGTRIEWDAELVDNRPGRCIAWRSLAGADVEHQGSVHFERAPGGRGTVVRVELDYRPPAGRWGASLAALFGHSPEKRIDVDLHRLKQLMETGEIARTEGQPAGRRSSTSRLYDRWVRA